MYGSLSLQLAKDHQDELRRESAQHRLAAKAKRASEPKRPGLTRRVFGLRLSPA